MADNADAASLIEATFLKHGLAISRQKELRRTGRCRWCNEKLPESEENRTPSQLFCDVDCRDDYEYARRRR